MKKVTQLLTVLAAGIMLLSTLALLICIVFQAPLMEMVYGEGIYYAQEGFSVPLGYIVCTLATTLIAAALCFTVCSQKVGYWTEIFGALLIAVGFPVISDVIDGVQNHILAEYFSATSLARQSLVVSLCSYSLSFVGVATSLIMVACGMSIAYKHLTRKALRDAATD